MATASLSPVQRAELQQALESKLAQAQQRFNELDQARRAKPPCYADAIERAFYQTQRRTQEQQMEREQTRIEELRQALERLEQGCYGVCQRSGEPIPFERLRLMPEARFAEGSGQG